SWTSGAGNSPPPDQAQPSAARQPARHSSMPADPAEPVRTPPETPRPPAISQPAHTQGYRQPRSAAPRIANRTPGPHRQTVALQPLVRRGCHVHVVSAERTAAVTGGGTRRPDRTLACHRFVVSCAVRRRIVPLA